MIHGAHYLRSSVGQIVRVSNDRGPHKICTVECDGKQIEALVGETFGVQANPHKDALVLVVFPDGDEGKAYIVSSMPRPKDRVDQQKEGEVTLKNHDTGNSIQHNAGGDTVHKAKEKITTESGGDTIIKSGGIVHINP